MTTKTVVSPTDGLMPMTIPMARLHARRRGVTPPRSCRSSGRRILHRTNSRMNCGTSTSRFDAHSMPARCGTGLASRAMENPFRSKARARPKPRPCGEQPGGRLLHAVPRAGRLFKSSLRCRQPRRQQTEWRAGDVVEADLVAELDRLGIAAMFAAD